MIYKTSSPQILQRIVNQKNILEFRIKWLLIIFIIGLVVSGLTAIPLDWEVELLSKWFNVSKSSPVGSYSGMRHWIAIVHEGLSYTSHHYPFMGYGTDWLAFAHIVIAICFIGPLRDPIRNVWVIQFGVVACLLIIPWAMIFGAIRGIPFYWRLIDCSFGLIGLIPLCLCLIYIKNLEKQAS